MIEIGPNLLHAIGYAAACIAFVLFCYFAAKYD